MIVVWNRNIRSMFSLNPRNSQIELKNFNLEYRENQVSLRHPVHRYCIQHHTTNRIPNTNGKSGSCSGAKAVRLRGYVDGKNL